MDVKAFIKAKGQLIDGQWLAEGNLLESINPASGEVCWQGYSACPEHVDQAFVSAKSALPRWAALGFEGRCQIAKNFAKKVEENRNEMASIIAMETGKPLWEAHTEVNSVIAKVDLSIEAYLERTGEKHCVNQSIQSSLRYKPHGVTLVLGAYNFPAHISNGHIVPALLAGNTVIFKASEYTSAVAEIMMQCWLDAGLPAGVMNCLHGGAETAKLLLAQDIKGVYFTGSFNTGKRIHQQFAGRPEVILALEMGGNNPLVLGQTKHMSAAVYTTLLSSYMTAGQRCTCARRVIIPDNESGDAYLKQLIAAATKIKTSAFHKEEEAFMGPVISYGAALNHLEAQKQLLSSGAHALLEMKLQKDGCGFLSPGIVDMSSVQSPKDEEIFAPLIQIYRYADFDHALALANQTAYGLSAGLLSDESQEYQQFFDEIEAGLINWNRPTTGASSRLPFGGVGLSGNHRPSAWFAADYCAYPVASQEESSLKLPENLLPGIGLSDEQSL